MTIETVTKFRTDDEELFDSEAEAIAHEKKVDLIGALHDNGFVYPGDVLAFVDTHRDAILEYLTGEDLPQPHPAPTFGYRDGDSIEPVHPILSRGEVIRQPEDAWNACRQYALELLNKHSDSCLPESPKQMYLADLIIELSRKLTLDQEITDVETSS